MKMKLIKKLKVITPSAPSEKKRQVIVTPISKAAKQKKDKENEKEWNMRRRKVTYKKFV